MKKQRGFSMITVIVIIVILLSILMTVTMLGQSHGRDIIRDSAKNKSYYIAKSGLEIVRSSLYGINEIGNEIGKNIIAKKQDEMKSQTVKTFPKELLIDKTDLDIKSNDDNVIGKATVEAYFGNNDAHGFYYLIISKGMLKDENGNYTDDKSHTLTMLILDNSPNNPKIYEGRNDDIGN